MEVAVRTISGDCEFDGGYREALETGHTRYIDAYEANRRLQIEQGTDVDSSPEYIDPFEYRD